MYARTVLQLVIQNLILVLWAGELQLWENQTTKLTFEAF